MITKHELIKKQEEKYIGKKFGILTGHKIIGKDKHHHYKVECICDCGNIVIVFGSSLRTGKRRHCGCEHKNGKEHALYKGYEGLSMSHWTRIKKTAKLRKYSVDVDIVYAWNLYEKQERKCAMSGVPIFFCIQKKDYAGTTASLDRIDNKKGYIEGNIQWVHKKINQIKMDLTVEDFFELCKKVVKYNNLLEN